MQSLVYISIMLGKWRLTSHLSIFIVWTKATTSTFIEEVATLCIDMYGQATCPLSKLEMLFPNLLWFRARLRTWIWKAYFRASPNGFQGHVKKCGNSPVPLEYIQAALCLRPLALITTRSELKLYAESVRMAFAHVICTYRYGGKDASKDGDGWALLHHPNPPRPHTYVHVHP